MSRFQDSLRAGVNGSRGYTNGYGNFGDDEYSSGYDRSDDDRTRLYGRPSPGRPRRAGGYGGFAQDEEPYGGGYGDYGGAYEPEQPRVQRPTSIERSRPADWSSSRSRSNTRRRGDGEGNQRLDDVLQYIKRDWNFMTEQECVPVQVALKLLDPSSLGLARRYKPFQDTSAELQGSLKVIVNEHHQGFNSSIGTFHQIQSSIQSSQARVRNLRDTLIQAKTNLSTTRPELGVFAVQSREYDGMLQQLAIIEQLQNVPDKLEGKISEKRFLTAVDILQDALKLMRRSETEKIGALSDLSVYLSNQEQSLTDILIEELHNHLYLRSPYCEDRWKEHLQTQTGASGADGTALGFRSRKIYTYLDQLDISVPLTDDASRNPEADTFPYIRLIAEALNNMSCLDVAVDAIEQRLPVELFRVVDRCNKEVDQRYPSALRPSKTKRGKLELAQDDATRDAMITDLLTNIYARFEAIAEGHRVFNDVVAGISRREGLRDPASMTRGFKELWKLYQSEIRSLLHDYLATDGDQLFSSGQRSATKGNVFNRAARDKTKAMFQLSQMDDRASDYAREKDQLDLILKSSVPGLVPESRKSVLSIKSNDDSRPDGGATGHALLVDPSVFNMGTLLPPSLSFLTRLKDVVPPSSDLATSTLTRFLDDFLVNVFVPQLEETLGEMCGQAFLASDTFQVDAQWSLYSRKPIFRGTTKFFNLITAFCKMLDNLPHDQAFSQLIITQMVEYYSKCFEWFKAMVSRSQFKGGTERRLKRAAALAESGPVRDAVAALEDATPQSGQSLLEKATEVLIDNVKTIPIEEADLISDQKLLGSLCTLYSSLKWLAGKIAQLRYISGRAIDSSRGGPRGQLQPRWTLLTSPDPSPEDAAVYLPLNPETAGVFDGVVNSYHELSNTVLRTLHIEIRCQIMFHLGRSLSGSYLLQEPLNDPDAEVLDLNTHLVAFDEEASANVRPLQREFIAYGLGLLMDHFIVGQSSKIEGMNANGCGRMQLNILVLQQNLRSLEPDALLSRSAKYFDLFIAGPDNVIDLVQMSGSGEVGFSYQEIETLLKLFYSEGKTAEAREVAMQAETGLAAHFEQLSKVWKYS